jgi:hypothetical protein
MAEAGRPAWSRSTASPNVSPSRTRRQDVLFALNHERPLCAFAGIWTEFKGDRGTKSKPVPGPHLVYGFLTTPNAIVESDQSATGRLMLNMFAARVRAD